jgi:hypothetical protein
MALAAEVQAPVRHVAYQTGHTVCDRAQRTVEQLNAAEHTVMLVRRDERSVLHDVIENIGVIPLPHLLSFGDGLGLAPRVDSVALANTDHLVFFDSRHKPSVW